MKLYLNYFKLIICYLIIHFHFISSISFIMFSLLNLIYYHFIYHFLLFLLFYYNSLIFTFNLYLIYFIIFYSEYIIISIILYYIMISILSLFFNFLCLHNINQNYCNFINIKIAPIT